MTALAALALAFAQESAERASAEAQREAVLGKLRTMRVDVNFQDETLLNVITYLQEYTGLNFLIDPAVEDPSSVTVSVKIKGIRVISLLKLILNEHDLAAVYKEGLIVIMPRSEANAYVVTRVYDVRDILQLKVNNFPGPRLELLPGAGAGGVPGVAVTMEEPLENVVDESTIEDLVRLATGERAWDENEHAQLQFLPNGMLLVTNTRQVHEQVARLIRMLRWFR